MATPIETFTQDVHRCFLDYFQKEMGPVDSRLLLAFLPLGSPVSPQQFKLHPEDTTYDSAVAEEQCSDLANALPRLNEGVYTRSLAHLSDQYRLLLSAVPAPGVDDSAFVSVKADASRLFEATLGSMDPGNPIPHHPAVATPKDWYDPTNQTNWTSYSFQVTEQSTAAAPPPAPPVSRPPIRNWGWQILPPVIHPVGPPTPPPPAAFHMAGPMMMMAPPIASPAPTNFARPMNLSAVIQMHPPIAAAPIARPAAPTPLMINFAARTALSAQVVNAAAVSSQAQPQHVTATSLTVTFQYCMVQVDRPWLSSAFIDNRNWYIPGYQAGALACGAFDATSSVPDDAPLSALPIAFIVVKNLKIAGNWSASDLQALNQAPGFGPFSLMERTSASTDTLIECDGPQIIAWFCQALPVLPPQAEPAAQAQAAAN